MHELGDFHHITQSEDHISISSLSDEELKYFTFSKASWTLPYLTGSSGDSGKATRSLSDSACKDHDEPFPDFCTSTEVSCDDMSQMSSCSLSFQLVQDLEEADESIFYPLPQALIISSCRIGTVLQTVNDIVTVISDGSETVVDIGTFVGTANRVIGPVITLFGPVKSCYYAIRVDSPLESDEVSSGDPIFLVEGTVNPIQEDVHLESVKTATDASYLNDKELPLNVMPDFSDDEAERNWKSRKRKF